jgi:hypothetical protein
MKLCKLCGRSALQPGLDFGDQALTNRFLHSPEEPQYMHPLSLAVCAACGLVQLTDAAPPPEVRSRFPWLSYNEPESHLDDLVRHICRLPDLDSTVTVAGLSYKDESTLRRLRASGLGKTWVADPADLGIDHPLGGIESIQQSLTRPTAQRLTRKHGRSDVVIVRHVLEHAHDLHEFLNGLRELVAPGGYLVVEVPDAGRALEQGDYSTVWEEHIFYFTPATLQQCFALTGFEVVFLNSYFYTHENSLVAIVRPSAGEFACLSPDRLHAEVRRFNEFQARFPQVRSGMTDYLERTRRAGPVALLGAGHLSAAFINLLGLDSCIDFIADDNPNKQGLYMPGSRCPIVGSQELVERDVRLCLMTVRPEIEETVVRKNRAFTERGGRLASIFPGSPYALALQHRRASAAPLA